jgi:signal transduction histidine kinase
VDRVAAIVRDVGTSPRWRRGASTSRSSLLEAVLRWRGPNFRRLPDQLLPGDPEVGGSSQELKQVFLNLLINAIQAMDGEGVIRLGTAHQAGRVIVSVEDEGCGIPEDAIEHIFDPFFTTKPVGKGTGLGLSISYQIVRNHGGEISVASRSGVGTIFRVTLPEVHRTA